MKNKKRPYLILVLTTLAILFVMYAIFSQESSAPDDFSAAIDKKNYQLLNPSVSNSTADYVPNSYYDEINNRTYVVWSGGVTNVLPGYPTSAMNVYIKYYDHNSDSWSQSVEVFKPKDPMLYGDGHYAQGVIVANNGSIHVFQTYHISLRPENSTQDIPIRTAVSKAPNSIHGGWKVNDIPGTGQNTHGKFFKSKSGNIYGIYRKTTLHNQKPFKETQMLIKSTNNGDSYQVSEFIVPPMDTTREKMRDDNEVLVTGDATWSTARVLDIKYDKGLDALHVIFDTTHDRKHSKNVYHVLYNFYSDTFTAAGNGINLGNKIDGNRSEWNQLDGCCSVRRYDPLAKGESPVEVMFGDAYKLYFYYIDNNAIYERTLDWQNGRIWSNPQKIINSKHYTIEDSIYKNRDKRYIFTLADVNKFPKAEARVYEFNGEKQTWNFIKIEGSILQSDNQVRKLTVTQNYGRDITGFFISPDHSGPYPTYSMSDYGYYDGPVKSKLVAFKLNGATYSSVFNNGFEKDINNSWYTKNDIAFPESGIINCQSVGPCAIGSKYLKLYSKNDNVGNFDPYITSEYIDSRENLDGVKIRVKYMARVDSGTAVYNGITIQRQPNAQSSTPWDKTMSSSASAELTTSWKQITSEMTIPISTNGNKSQLFRVVVRPIGTVGKQALLIDDIQTEVLGNTQFQCDTICATNSQCGNANNSWYCASQFNKGNWSNVSSNLSSLTYKQGNNNATSTASITGFNNLEFANGVIEQHVVKGGKIYFRKFTPSTGWENIWQDVTSNIPSLPGGNIIDFNSYLLPNGITEQHLIKSSGTTNIIYSQNNASGWANATWTNVTQTSGLLSYGTGPITGFTSYVDKDGYVVQNMVRGGQLWERTNAVGWATAPWRLSNELQGCAGTESNKCGTNTLLSSERTQFSNGKNDFYIIRSNGMIYYQSSNYTEKRCRLNTNPSTSTCTF